MARTREREAACRGLVEKPQEKRPLGRPRFKWENIKMDIFKWVGRAWIGLTWPRLGTRGGLG